VTRLVPAPPLDVLPQVLPTSRERVVHLARFWMKARIHALGILPAGYNFGRGSKEFADLALACIQIRSLNGETIRFDGALRLPSR